ncbi:hypothetical protein NHH03_23420 [Stieleria sp. TO1_6]|uniref:hypothetical protein n=1 Tax=Stieleria tagensis TaxID=2956795 RepID=UPI00209B6AFD|nr:hypothetical protein [Stieleria tagensis]MCO8124709.1 hypothetical protein [Stieleria tagensis]
MTTLHSHRNDLSAFVAQVAREVIRRLRESQATACESSGENPSGEKLITLATLSGYADDRQVTLAPGGVVTPAAREEAARRRITFSTSPGVPAITASASSAAIASPQSILTEQLARRGVSIPAATEIIWTDQPAAEVYARCSIGRRAVLISAIGDVDRFATELSPDVWILDQQKLNLVAAVNAAARIARLANHSPGDAT